MSDLKSLFKAVLSIIVKLDVTVNAEAATDLKNIYLSKNEKLLKDKDIQLGFAVNTIIANLRKKDAVISNQIMEFKQGTKQYTVCLIRKIFERILIANAVIQNSMIFNTIALVTYSLEILSSKMRRLLEYFFMHNIFSSDKCDFIHRQSLRKKCLYSELFWSECGKIQTRITLNIDTFHTVSSKNFFKMK